MKSRGILPYTTLMKILMPIPSSDFDPTEVSVPWKTLSGKGHEIRFATPDGLPGDADPRMLSGQGLGIFTSLLRARRAARELYAELSHSTEFLRPLSWDEVRPEDFDGLILPGGHAPGMKKYLESKILQKAISGFFESEKPVGAICHGVVLASRSRAADGRSVIHGRRATTLPKWMELSAWLMTALWLGRYYRTYPETCEDEVRAAIVDSRRFVRGPLTRRPFTVLDGKFLSARWPGDAERFALEFDRNFTPAKP